MTLCLFLASVHARIVNTNVKRQVRLDEAGSSLVTFVNDITFTKDVSDKVYFYTIAEDYMWSFVDLQAITIDEKKGDKVLELEWDRVNTLPNELVGNGTNNVQAFQIKLPEGVNRFAVKEYHKGRMEPYPKVIRVYEKQKVELYDNKYYLSVYSTEASITNYFINEKDVHYLSEPESSRESKKITYGPFKHYEPMTFDQI